MQKKKGARRSNGERRICRNLLSEEKLGAEEEGVSLSISIGSMAAVALAPARGGAVAGLAEDPRALMLAAEAESSARLREEARKTKCGEGKRLPSPSYLSWA